VTYSQSVRRLALAEQLCRSANGSCARRLTAAFEATDDDIDGEAPGLDRQELKWFDDGRRSVTMERRDHWAAVLEQLSDEGVTFATVADADYPTNLRVVHDRPPFLFVRGAVTEADDKAIAVVGTRQASTTGLEESRAAARGLASHGVTVVSGLARGIDAAAHEAALDAGGRTIAVFGTGIRRISPAANRELAARIVKHGACVSQFLPDQGGTTWTFPVRNMVTSGLSIGTLVIEAGPDSGARIQARDTMRHGRRLFLMSKLVDQQQWAADLSGNPSVTIVDDIEEVVRTLDREMQYQTAVLV